VLSCLDEDTFGAATVHVEFARGKFDWEFGRGAAGGGDVGAERPGRILSGANSIGSSVEARPVVVTSAPNVPVESCQGQIRL